jgi:ribosomal protein S27E
VINVNQETFLEVSTSAMEAVHHPMDRLDRTIMQVQCGSCGEIIDGKTRPSSLHSAACAIGSGVSFFHKQHFRPEALFFLRTVPAKSVEMLLLHKQYRCPSCRNRQAISLPPHQEAVLRLQSQMLLGPAGAVHAAMRQLSAAVGQQGGQNAEQQQRMAAAMAAVMDRAKPPPRRLPPPPGAAPQHPGQGDQEEDEGEDEEHEGEVRDTFTVR